MSEVITQEANVTVDYEELDGSPNEKYDLNGFRATRLLACRWPDRHKLAQQLRGGYQTYGDKTMLIYPAAYADYPYARVSSVGIEGKGRPENELSTDPFEKAWLTVDYKIPETNEETLIEESLEPAAEFLTLPNKGLFWGVGDAKVPLEETEAPGFMLNMSTYVYTLKYSKKIPSWFEAIEGKTNTNTVTISSLGRTYQPETLLAGRPSSNRITTTFGEKAWTFTVRITHRNIEWNRFPRTGFGGVSFEHITDGTNIIKPYTPVDFGFLS